MHGRRLPDERTLLAHSRILEYMAEGVNVSDRRGVIFFTNRAFEKMFGYGHGELHGQHVSVLNAATEDENRALVANIIESLETEGTWSGEFENRRKDGSPFVTEARISAVTIDGEEYWVSVQEDVTERRGLETHLRRLQKIEALGTLAGGLAHDFNNVLLAIQAPARILQGRLQQDPVSRELAEEVTRAVQHGASLARQLLALGRRDAAPPTRFDVVEQLERLRPMLARLAGETASLSIDVGPEPLFVEMDPGQLDQALMNLVLNARDAEPTDRRITVRAHGRPAPSAARVPGVAVIQILDRGRGMDAETLARAFEPFFTTKGLNQGTGLGLAMVLGIVERAGGSVHLESTPERGTTATLELPLVESVGSDADPLAGAGSA